MALHHAISLPRVGAPTRVEVHGVRWLLEKRGAAIFCAAMDDTLLFEGYLALPAESEDEASTDQASTGQASNDQAREACIEVHAPDYPVELSFANSIVLAPTGKLAGYVPLPTTQRFVVRTQAGAFVLATTSDRDLRLGFRENEGYYHAQEESLRDVMEPLPRDRNRFWIRLEIENRGCDVWRPKRCRLDLAGRDILRNGEVLIGPRVQWIRDEQEQLHIAAAPSHAVAPATPVVVEADAESVTPS